MKTHGARPVPCTASTKELLGRAEVPLDLAGIRKMVRSRRILVTGAGGTIGSELCRQILALEPRLLVMSERSEPRLFELLGEIEDRKGNVELVPSVADVSVESAVDELFEAHRPELVFHAAAHKHVVLMESQPAEAIRNNTLATAALIRAAHRSGVDRFVMISTDKAIRPASVMGASKRLAEIFLQAFHRESKSQTRFLAVRFGNVLGSSGSVVEIFRRQISTGGPVKVTHPEVQRYFMTVDEAVGLVLQSALMGRGGEILGLDMGLPVRIAELAEHMITQAGLIPGKDVKVEFIGLRPGEKLSEDWLQDLAAHKGTAHDKVFRFLESTVPLSDIDAVLSLFAAGEMPRDAEGLRRRIQSVVPEYTPPDRGQWGRVSLAMGSRLDV